MLTTCRILMRESVESNLSEYSWNISAKHTHTKGKKSSSEDLINIDRRLNLPPSLGIIESIISFESNNFLLIVHVRQISIEFSQEEYSI